MNAIVSCRLCGVQPLLVCGLFLRPLQPRQVDATLFMISSYYFSMHCRVFCRCMCRMILSLCYVLLCGRAFLVDEPPLVDVLSHAMLNEGWVTSLLLVFSKYWFVKIKTT
jgi:hypothetical protein